MFCKVVAGRAGNKPALPAHSCFIRMGSCKSGPRVFAHLSVDLWCKPSTDVLFCRRIFDRKHQARHAFCIQTTWPLLGLAIYFSLKYHILHIFNVLWGINYIKNMFYQNLFWWKYVVLPKFIFVIYVVLPKSLLQKCGHQCHLSFVSELSHKQRKSRQDIVWEYPGGFIW